MLQSVSFGTAIQQDVPYRVVQEPDACSGGSIVFPNHGRRGIVPIAPMTPILPTGIESAMKSHLQHVANNTQLSPDRYSDCVVCGQSLECMKRQPIFEYIMSMSKTYPSETECQVQSRIDAYIAGMNSGTFLFATETVTRLRSQSGKRSQLPSL